MYGTRKLPRADVRPGMTIIHQKRTWKASANPQDKGLYVFTLFEKIKITDEFIEVVLGKDGEPEIVH